jgi:hypothetical protein
MRCALASPKSRIATLVPIFVAVGCEAFSASYDRSARRRGFEEEDAPEAARGPAPPRHERPLAI